MIVALPACNEAPSDSSALVSAAAAAEGTGDSAANVILFSLGGEQQEFPTNTCMITPVIVAIQGKQGETTVDLSYDGRAKVSYQHHFEKDGVGYWNQWDSKRDDIQFSTEGKTATASGTMQNTNQWKQGPENNWVNMGGSEPLDDQPFTFSATCN
ncbi:MAG: hypothetical protein GY783_07390 [Gammaproteobacteria bacterium]|nr:hypothetical protein [Gammaproteobacteria bacterium]